MLIVTTNPGTQTETEACGRLAVPAIVLESMLSLAGGTWTYARWENMAGRCPGLCGGPGSWGWSLVIFLLVMSCPRYQVYKREPKEKKCTLDIRKKT